MDDKMLGSWSPRLLGLLRIVSGLIFMEHGTQKLLGFPAGQHANVSFNTLSAYAGVIELVAGLLIAIGLFTRPAAFLASGTMAVAYWYAHAPQSFFPVNNGGDAAILYCFLFLYIAAVGPGPWSVDGMRRRDGRR
jgi:putative oxidoreductase